MATAMTQETVLRSLHESPAHTAQKKAWEADLKAFEQFKGDQEDELRRARGEAYQVATMYAMFQGVIFTAVSQSSLLTCALWWCPFSLCVTVYAATILAIADKLKSFGELDQDITETALMMSAIQSSLDKMEQQGSTLDLVSAQPQAHCTRPSVVGFRSLVSRDGLFALLFLTSFSVLVGWFSIHALCEHCAPCRA